MLRVGRSIWRSLSRSTGITRNGSRALLLVVASDVPSCFYSFKCTNGPFFMRLRICSIASFSFPANFDVDGSQPFTGVCGSQSADDPTTSHCVVVGCCPMNEPLSLRWAADGCSTAGELFSSCCVVVTACQSTKKPLSSYCRVDGFSPTHKPRLSHCAVNGFSSLPCDPKTSRKIRISNRRLHNGQSIMLKLQN